MLALMSPRRGVALVRKRAKPSCRAQSDETVTQTLKLFKHFFKVFVITSTRSLSFTCLPSSTRLGLLQERFDREAWPVPKESNL